ncbi:CCC motif membrane protein [Algibacter sp. 2305UL17-15]|uniref:CCC motif membrane protein n=1 Tax=Algibacter sp. 2305UL17-15 TaxID=3231268 RepID=UPI0034598AD8
MNKLPADPTSLILGIVALVFSFTGCCCYGIVAVIPLTLSIIGLVMANKSLKEYAQNPEAYSPQTQSNVSTGKILNIVALVFSGVLVLYSIGVLIFYGTMLSSGILDEFKNFEKEETFEFENDTLYDGFEYYEDEETLDTTNTEILRKTFQEG